MRKWITGCIVLGLALGGAIAVSQEKEADVPIKEVMKKAHAGGTKSLLSRVQSGKAGDDDKKLLLELYQALGKHKPPKGDEDVWKKKTGTMIEAAQAAVDGKKNAGILLKKAVNCKDCHGAHKV